MNKGIEAQARRWRKAVLIAWCAVGIVGGIALSVWTLFEDNPYLSIGILCVGVVCQIVVQVRAGILSAKASEEGRDAADALTVAVRRELETLGDAVNANIGGDLNHLRTTIYAFDFSHGRFIPVCRRSANRRLRRIGRSHYPDDKGFISTVWDEEFGAMRCSPEAIDEKYREMGLTDAVIRRLTMRATSMIGVRLQWHGEPTGLILVECDSGNRDIYHRLKVLRSDVELLECVSSLIFNIREHAELIRDCDPDKLDDAHQRHRRRPIHAE